MYERDELVKLTETLLNRDATHAQLLNAARSLSEFFERFSPISTRADRSKLGDDATHTYLSSGIAISPLDAAICTNEYMRTAKYLRGVYEAMNDLITRFQSKKVQILYAGCGPYATLVIPLLHYFDPKNVEVHFLDIHASALRSVKTIIDKLGFEEFVSGYIQEDATLYKAKSDLHMVITETMKAAFDNEPQIAVTLNLLPQLHEEGIFIPQRVVVGFETAHYKPVVENSVIHRIKDSNYLCDVIDMDTTQAMSNENFICTKAHSITKNIDEKMDAQFTTTIYIYSEHVLRENECSLNIPKKITFERKLAINDTVHFAYKFKNVPTIEYTLNEVESFKDWIPQRVVHKYNEAQIVWHNMKGKRFTEPFFDNTLSSSHHKRYTSWEKLQSVAKEVEAIYPSGFIFHTSRCGSTLLSQSLALFDDNIVLSEAQLIHEALTAYQKNRVELLKDVIRVLGQKRFANEKRLFIKFDAWSIAELPLILEAYPNVPWVFLYRNPVEILVSQKRQRGLFTIAKALNGKVFDQISEKTHYDHYYKEVIFTIFEFALKYKDLPHGLFIDYKELKEAIIDEIFPHFKLHVSDEELKNVNTRIMFDAKNPKDNFKDDAKEKHDAASEDIKHFCNRYMFDIYNNLNVRSAV